MSKKPVNVEKWRKEAKEILADKERGQLFVGESEIILQEMAARSNTTPEKIAEGIGKELMAVRAQCKTDQEFLEFLIDSSKKAKQNRKRNKR